MENLDFNLIASARSKRARQRGDKRGLEFLFAHVRRDIEQRWAQVYGDDAARVLWCDFDDTAPQFGEGVIVQCASLIDIDVDADLTYISGGKIGGGEFDGVVIGLQMAWLSPPIVFAHAMRYLREGGVLLFCTFGPDTLLQLRDAWHEVDAAPHVHPFIDMHILGDQLLQSGFARPIVDSERINIEYPNSDTLFADLRDEGFTNILHTRRKTLTGKSRFAAFESALNNSRPNVPQNAPQNSSLHITCELIYGTATAPHQSAPGQVRVAEPQMPK